ncbi:MAG: preprotein translocase subunit YajC [Actinomycetota bacterium]|nr:preprotein translocase subunit YajC [Actinomycetota bacterium]
MEGIAGLLPFLLILALFWLLILRPARKKQQAVAQLRAGLSPGDAVLLGSGLYGTITAIADDGLRVEISPGVVVRVHRDAVVSTEQPITPRREHPPGQDAEDEPRPPPA